MRERRRFGVARRHIAVEHARGIRRIALNRANMQALGNGANGGTASSLGLLLRRRKDAVAPQHQANHITWAQSVDDQRRQQGRRQVALECHHGARRTVGPGVSRTASTSACHSHSSERNSGSS